MASARPITADARPADPGSGYLEWGAVLGGTAVAGAMSIVLLQFGVGVGVAAATPTLDDGSASWSVLVAGLWVALVALVSASAGGYIAGRMRSRWGDAVEAEAEFRDGVHGLVVWGVSTIVVGIAAALIAALSAAGMDVAASAADGDVSDEVLRLTANVSTIFAFATAAGAAVGAAAAWFAATVGGQHRDEGLSIHQTVPRALRRR